MVLETLHVGLSDIPKHSAVFKVSIMQTQGC